MTFRPQSPDPLVNAGLAVQALDVELSGLALADLQAVAGWIEAGQPPPVASREFMAVAYAVTRWRIALELERRNLPNQSQTPAHAARKGLRLVTKNGQTTHDSQPAF